MDEDDQSGKYSWMTWGKRCMGEVSPKIGFDQ